MCGNGRAAQRLQPKKNYRHLNPQKNKAGCTIIAIFTIQPVGTETATPAAAVPQSAVTEGLWGFPGSARDGAALPLSELQAQERQKFRSELQNTASDGESVTYQPPKDCREIP